MTRDWGVKLTSPFFLFLIAWLVVPFTIGSSLDLAFTNESDALRVFNATALWLTWSIVLGACVVRRPWALTVIRLIAPSLFFATLLTHAIYGIDTTQLLIALSHAVLIALLALLPELGNHVVDGISYGDERRFLLRVPSAIIAGPLPLVWAITILSIFVGPSLAASQQPGIGVLLTVIGWPLAYLGFRSLHQLANRWIVFVPNGFVIHDYLATREPFLLRRQDIAFIGPAPSNTDVEADGLVDVSQLAFGPVLQATLKGEVEIVLRSKGVSEVLRANSVLFSPTRPGAVLLEAKLRKLVR